jgi:HTH-type transcriptional regulator/antitoxin HigA
MPSAQTLDEEKYTTLLASLSPRPITSDAEHKELLEITSSLISKEDRSPEESTLLSLLAILISSYERDRYAHRLAERNTPAEMLSYLMEENHLTQNDFAPIPQSRVSEILAGKRKISLSQARVLGRRFKVNPALFLFLSDSTAQ